MDTLYTDFVKQRPEHPAAVTAIYWMGKARIPTVIFAAGVETTAHSLLDQVPLDDLVRATEWYALLPAVIAARGA